MNLSAIKQIAQTEMADKRSSPYNERGDKYTHGERVAALAVRLRRLIFPSESGYDDILTVSAWFHDIRNGMVDHSQHAVIGAQRVRELLTGHCTNEELEQICELIAVHDERKPRDKAYSNAVKIHQDADHLDHFGSFDIWRLVVYTAGHDETINDALKYLKTRWRNDNAHWRTDLNFKLSKSIFDDKTRFVKTFIERFAVEGAGEICNEKMLMAEIGGAAGNAAAKLETERLTLSPFAASDAEAMFRNWAGDPDVVRYLPYDVCGSIKATRERIGEWLQYFRDAAPNSWGLFAIELKSTGELIGTIDYAETDSEARSAEVGYQLGKAWWGKGYAAEALRAVLAHCFETVKLNRVWADYDSRNPNSGRVMQKAGMLYEGTFRHCKSRRGELIDKAQYALLAGDYFGKSKPNISIIAFDPKYRDDMLYCFLAAKDALGAYAPDQWSKPSLKDDLLDIKKSYLERGDVFYLALDERDRVVGMLGTQTASPTELWLKRLFIKPEIKGRGIGSKLLAAVEEYAAGKGIAAIHTRFAHWYHEAAAFYPAKGFVEAESDKPYLRHLVKTLNVMKEL